MLNTLKIDKSLGPDELHSRVLKEISSSITKPLYHIFKQSLEIGKLPSDWKTALVRERPFNLKGRGYVFFLKKYSDSQCC